MIIAISQRQDLNKHGGWMDNLENSYNSYFSSFGITLIPIPNFPERVGDYVSKISFDGIVLSGGNDVCPRSYNEEINLQGCSLQRDNTEKRMLEIAVQRKIPVLGICRGMQFINVFFGGKLQRDINKEKAVHQLGIVHEIKIIDEKAKIFLGREVSRANSFHNQAVTFENISPRFKVFAVSDAWEEKEEEIEEKQLGGRFVEGLYHPSLPIVGVQWHPERESPDKEINEKIMKAFVERKWVWES